MRAHVPEPHGAASTWPGPHTSALGDTPWASGSSWMRTLSTWVFPSGDLDVQLGIDRLADCHPALRKLAGVLAPDRDASAGGVDHREDVADAYRDVERQLADAVDLDDLVGERHE